MRRGDVYRYEPVMARAGLEIDRPPRRRLVECLGRASTEELELVDNAIRAVFEI